MKDYLLRKIGDFSLAYNVIPCEIISLAIDHDSFNVDELYEEIQLEIKNNNIDKSIYSLVTTFAISESWIDNKRYRFLINNRSIYEYDVKILLLHGYIYIFHKPGFTFTHVSLVLHDNDVFTLNDDNNEINDIFNTSITLNIKSTIDPDLAISLNKTFYVLKNNEDNITILKNKYPDTYNDEVLLHKPIYYLQYNKSTGFFNDPSKLENKPLYIKNTSSDPNDLLLVVYDHKLDYTKYDNIYYKEIYGNKDRFKCFFNYMNDLPIPYGKYINYEFLNNNDIITTCRDFMYDIYNDILKYNLPCEILFTNKDFEISSNMDSLIDVDYNPLKRGINYRSYIKLNFHNPRNRIPEVFFEGRLYQGYKLVEKNANFTTIGIKLDVFRDYFELGENDKIDNITVLLKPDTYHHYHYEDITKEYNSVVPIGRWFFSGFHKRRYINGYLSREEDFGFNTIPPYNLLCTFPKRKAKGYDIYDTHYVYNRYIIKKDLHLKYKNITSNITDIINSNDKYIYKNYLFTDYIDYEYQIYSGPYLLQKDVDYEILSCRCIRFLKPLYKYKEDNIDNDYIDITIENIFNKDKDMYKELAYKSSYLKRFFENENIITYLTNLENDTIVLNRKDRNDCNGLYDQNAYETHMYLTKYFSSEVVLNGQNEVYGSSWFNKLKAEFPQFVNEHGTVSCDYDLDDNIKMSEIPRVVTLPENEPLNLLIGNDIIAKNRLKYLNIDLPYGDGTNEKNNEFFMYKFYSKNILGTLIGESMKYLYTIPFNAIYRNDDEEE